MFEPPTALPWCSQACTDVWHGYTVCQKTVYQKQSQQVEGEFDVEIVGLIVQQLHAGVISVWAFAPIWLIFAKFSHIYIYVCVCVCEISM